MTTRRGALGGLALLASGLGASGLGVPRDGSRGWRLELKATRGPADAVAAIRLLQDRARVQGGVQPQIVRRGPVRLVLTWRDPVEPEAAEAVFQFLPRLGVHELKPVPPEVSAAFLLPGAAARRDDPPVQLGAMLLDGNDLETATASRDRQGLPSVLLRWTAAGARRARRLTPRLLGRRVLVCVGGQPLSAPLITGRFRRTVEIGGLFTPETARTAAQVFNDGAVAGRLRLVESRPLRPGE